MDTVQIVGIVAMAVAGFTIAVGTIAPALGEARALDRALEAMAQQPDLSNTITRTLFVGLAMIESTAIYCLVVALILIFANPFWNQVVAVIGG
jgi:F-type H+-transporting ATPase subunit c